MARKLYEKRKNLWVVALLYCVVVCFTAIATASSTQSGLLIQRALLALESFGFIAFIVTLYVGYTQMIRELTEKVIEILNK